MNRIYQIIWSRVTQGWVVVAETARTARLGATSGRKSLKLLGCLAAVWLLFGVVAEVQALPQGLNDSTSKGDYRIYSSVPNALTIIPLSKVVALNWNSFNIAAGEAVYVNEPGQWLVINRVTGGDPSRIAGTLNTSGQFWLINPNGVLFSKGATVNVNSLLVSTLNTPNPSGDPSVYEGVRRFEELSSFSNAREDWDAAYPYVNQSTYVFSGSSEASITNQTTIGIFSAVQVDSRYVVFIAKNVSNQGFIDVAHPGSTAALVAGSDVTVNFPLVSPVSIKINASARGSVVQNLVSGRIRATEGQVLLYAGSPDSLLGSAVNNAGLIEATSFKEHRGQIYLVSGDSNGTTTVTGALTTSQREIGPGGVIVISGKRVQVDWRNIYARGYDKAEQITDAEIDEFEKMSETEMTLTGRSDPRHIPMEQDFVSVYADGENGIVNLAPEGFNHKAKISSKGTRAKWDNVYKVAHGR